MSINPGAVGGVNPAHQNTQAQQQAQHLSQQVEAATDAMQRAAEVFDTEAQGVNAKQVKSQLSGESVNTATKNKKDSHSPTTSAAYAASVSAQEELERKKRKKKIQSWEEKMEMLESMGEVIDPEDVPEEEQGIIQTFLKNLGTIRELRGKLKRIKKEREQLEALLEANKNTVKSQENTPPRSGGY